MQSKRVVIECLLSTFVPSYLLRVEFIHAKILNECTSSTLLNKHSTLLCKVDMEETHKLRVALKNLSRMRIFLAIGNEHGSPVPSRVGRAGRSRQLVRPNYWESNPYRYLRVSVFIQFDFLVT